MPTIARGMRDYHTPMGTDAVSENIARKSKVCRRCFYSGVRDELCHTWEECTHYERQLADGCRYVPGEYGGEI